MLVIKKKENENISEMLKRYKRKHRDARIMNEIRDRKHFTKRSVKRRGEILDAKYRNEHFK